jgi:hypothetical protein
MTRWYVFPLAAGIVAASALVASAADRPVLKAAPMKIEHGNLFYGFDATSHDSLAGYLGILYAPYGMHQSGIRFTAFGLYGRYEYNSTPDREARFWSGDLLVGWSNVMPNGAYTLSVGVNGQNHRISPFDPTNSVRGSEVGVKVQGDFWVNPSPVTLLTGLASYSTAFDTYYALLRAGYDFQGQRVYVGPEVVALGNERTDQVRLGLHASGIRIGIAKLNVSGGWMREKGEGTGWYGTATVDVPF